MARTTRTVEDIIDDLTGKATDEAELITFTDRHGVQWEMDLSAASLKTFDDTFAPIIEKARKVTKTRRRATTGKAKQSRTGEGKEIREWARKQGHKVAPRGRIDEEIVAAYRDAKRADTATKETPTA